MGQRRGAAEPNILHHVAAIWPLLLVIGTQVLIASVSIQILTASRAFVESESMWTKGYKNAVYDLVIYLQTGEERYLHDCETALRVPLGDRKARLALEGDRPDPEAARALLVEAGKRPEDAAAMVRLLRYARGSRYLQDAVRDWVRADALLLDVTRLAGVSAGNVSRVAAGHPRDAQETPARVI